MQKGSVFYVFQRIEQNGLIQGVKICWLLLHMTSYKLRWFCSSHTKIWSALLIIIFNTVKIF